MPQGFVAGGTILPYSFVKQSTTAPNTVLQAGAGDVPIGISQKGTRNTPYSTLNDGDAALVGEDILVFQENEYATIQFGGTVTAGDFLKPSTNGVAITAGSDGDVYGAKTNQAGTTGQLIEVLVLIGFRGA